MEILIEELKKSPGLVLVFAIIALLLLEDSSEIAAAIRVFVVAWGLYRIGSCLDWLLFDPIYARGPRPHLPGETEHTLRKLRIKLYNEFARLWYKLRKRVVYPFAGLEKKRHNAAKGLRQKGARLSGVEGLYRKTQEALKEDKKWETEVETWNNWSKAVRTFVLPLFAIVVARLAPRWLPLIPPEFRPDFEHLGENHLFAALEHLFASFGKDFICAREKLHVLFLTCSVFYAFVPAVLCLVCLLLYVSLRLHHMTQMYDLVAPPPKT
jgi:hypothetical protein